MPQLAVPRRGWENEHLATFLLSQIAFVAHPITVADDVGSDFFCTLFEERLQNGTSLLFPLNSFAIQVKSSLGDINATNKIEYLSNLEIPFFVGVVDRVLQELTIYSGEYLPILFPEIGIPEQLRLKLVERVDAFYTRSGDSCVLSLPLVVKFKAADEPSAIKEKAMMLAALCTRVHGNIAARRRREYIFSVGESGEARILAGSGSVQTFRQNLQLRLAEAFYNLEWVLRNRPSEFKITEFETYERFYRDLERTNVEMQPVLVEIYQRLKKLISDTA